MKTYNTYSGAKRDNPDRHVIAVEFTEKSDGFYAEKFAAIKVNNPEDQQEVKIIEAPEWNGEGYPPVGVECEMICNSHDWSRCTVKYVSKDVCVVDFGHDEVSYRTINVKFRPLETPEQKKEREELEAAYDLYKTIVDGEPLAYNFEQFRSSPSIGGYLKAVRKYLLQG